MSYNIFGQYALRAIEDSKYYDKEKGIDALLVIYGYAVVAEELSWDELERTGLEKAIYVYEISTRRVKEYLPKLFCNYPSEKDKELDFERRLIDVRCSDEDNIKKAIETIKERKENDSFSMDMEYWKDEPRFDPDDIWDEYAEELDDDTPKSISEISRDILEIKDELKGKIVGQEAAINQVMDGLMDVFAAAPKKDRNAPLGVFFFAGPPGVGKTMMADLIAKALKRPHKLFSMTSYASETDHFQLTGADKSYRNGHKGYLTEVLEKEPRTVLIFDEIEKSATSMQNIFLGILSSGEYTDEFTKETIDCRDTIMIFTSNAGKLLYEGKDNFASLPQVVLQDALLKEKKRNSRGEEQSIISAPLLSRLMSNTVVMFDNIGISELEMLTRRHMQEFCKSYMGMTIKQDKYLPLLFLYNAGNSLDARIVSGKSPAFIKRGIMEAMRQVGNKSDLFEGVKNIELKIDVPDNEEIKSLFVANEKIELYIVSGEKIKKKTLQARNNFDYTVGAAEINDIPTNKVFDAILVDPFTGMKEDKTEYIGLEDRDIPGVNFIKSLIEEKYNIPIYLLSSKEHPVSRTDEETFLSNGVKGILRWESDEEFLEKTDELSRNLYMINQYRKLSRRGYVLDYDTSVERKSGSEDLIIRYYNLRKKQAVDSATGQNALTEDERPKVSFDDVIGVEHAKEELKYYVEYMKDPLKHIRRGDAPARGILLYGPPGTGKTLLARAAAGESECTFFQLNAAEFIKGKVGEGEEKVRALFAKARKYAPSIIFIDEIDSIGKTRFESSDNQGITSILTTLFTEMDGFDTHTGEPVFVIAATNYGVRGENSLSLDPGLERRFNNRIYVELPKRDDRKKYLEYIVTKKNYSQITADAIDSLADRTVGRSLAEIEQVIDLMHRKAMRKGVAESDSLLADALDEYLYGREQKQDEESFKRTAVHEAGHVYMSWKCGTIPSFATIVSRGDFYGYVSSGEDEEKGAYSLKELRGKIRIYLAGKVSEEEFYDEVAINTGASSDLERASGLALDIVRRYGMDGENFAFCNPDWIQSPVASEYIDRAKEIIREETENCRKSVHEGREIVRKIADNLVENSYLTKDRLKEILEEKV